MGMAAIFEINSVKIYKIFWKFFCD